MLHLGVIAALLTLSLFQAGAQQDVVITSVWPSRGSLAGGTRMHIKGSGFSTNMNNDGNVVVIGGKYKCDVIPLHCTVNQIACKTQNAMTGAEMRTWASHRTTFPDGWIDDMDVQVTVDGARNSTCRPDSGASCTFSYHTGWYHSPRIQSIAPAAVSAGELITVRGQWYGSAFDNLEIKAPSQEIPMVSVKVANRPGELANPKNEPFGSSGARCLLFDQDVEEPFGIEASDGTDEVDGGRPARMFKCKVGPAPEAHRYNLSVAVLGSRRTPERDMNMGESMGARETYVADHEGMSFMLSHVATVEGITPSTSGSLGGDRITINGAGFPKDTSAVQVSIAGTPCSVLTSSDTEIICVLGPYNASAHPPVGMDQPGDRGVDARIWFDAINTHNFNWWNSDHRDALRTNASFFPTPPNVSTLYQDVIEAPHDIQSVNGDISGPMGTFKGFFRAPVTSNFTFILASDDQSQLWIGQNESTATQAIDFRSWCGHRDYSLNWEWSPYDYTPLSGIQQHNQRVSAPVEVVDGEFLYLSAMYVSGSGGDSFSLAVKQHTASVNRKDSPFAVDEKQTIFVSRPPPSDEQHLIALVPTSVGAELSGTFTLSAAGSTTRPIAVNATAQQVAAALREMLGSCSGAVGEENDSAGNSYDCVYGKGINYRGKANTYNGGQQCKMWRDAPDWNPRLALTAGLESNYCRNPDASQSSSVRTLWCYDHNDNKVRCDGAYNQCGLTSDDRAMAPYVATFEDESVNDDAPETAGFTMKEGVIPRISRDSAFCGQQSLYIPNGYTRLRRYSSGDRQVSEKLNGGDPTELSKFPYVCMAYKIPSTTYVAMRVEFRSCMEWSKTQANSCERWGGFWRTIDMTNPPGTYDEPTNNWRSIGSWGIIADGEWHYKCINVLEMLNINDRETMQYSAHQLRELDFYPHGQPKAGYGTNEFWIDEFSQSATPRAVNRKDPPAGLAGRVTRVSHVERAEVPGGGVTYKVNITYDDCSATKALDLTVNTTGVTGPLSPGTHLVSVPPPAPLSATVSVSYRGKVAEWGAVAPAYEVRDRLAPLIGNTKVMSTGTCADRGWEIHFLDLPGDQPPLAVSGTGDAKVFVETVEDGGLIMGPIPVDYMHRSVTNPQARVVVNKASTRCVGDACDFSYDGALTPTVDSSLAAQTIPLHSNGTGASLTISGTKLDTLTGVLPSVQLGEVPCMVSSATPTSINCIVSMCLPRAHYEVSVTVPGRGRASGALSAEITAKIASVTPASIDPALPAEIRVFGGGFSEDPSQNNVTVGGLTCDIVSATCSQLVCMYPGTSGGSRRTAGDLTVTLDVGGTPATTSGLISGSGGSGAAAPTVSSINPTKASAGGGTLLTVQGTDLVGGSVSVGGSLCVAVDNTLADSLTCILGPGSVGASPVSVTTASGSVNGPAFEYALSITSVTSQSGMGLGGGVDISLDGEGMVSGGGEDARIQVDVYGREVYVLSHYTPPLIREAQDLSLIGTSTDDVQTISIRHNASDAYEGDFTASWFGSTTAAMPRNVNEFLLQRALAALVPSHTNAIVSVTSPSSQEAGWIKWSVSVSSLMGDLPPISLSCGSCNATGLIVEETTQGFVTHGFFSLAATNASDATSVFVPANVTDSAFESLLMSELSIDAEVSSIIPPTSQDAIRTWRITFRGFSGVRPLLSAAPPAPETNMTLSAGGDLVVQRVTPGTGMPHGHWNIHMGGVSTSDLALNATEGDVKSAIESSFSTLKNVHVASIDDAPGPLSYRYYPRQWIVSFSRPDVAGLGIARCAHPKYIDWDPSICPSVAGDLFLTFHDWYWPSGLAKPLDIGTELSQQRFLRACAEEARTLNYLPLTEAECHARVPLETLAMCGVGSGTSPPCWNERFTTASVRHKDGTTVTYMRDDTRTPSDLEKGYRFWRQAGLQAAMEAQQMSANATVTIEGFAAGVAVDSMSGVTSRRASSKAAETFSYNATTVSASQLVAPSPRVTRHARTLPQIISDDVLYVPLSTWRLGSMKGLGIVPVPGALPQDDDGAAGMRNASLLAVPYSPTSNPPAGGAGGTVEMWVRPIGAISSEAMSPLVRSVGNDAASGYALGIDTDRRFIFLLGNGNVSQAPAPEARAGMLVFSSGAWMSCKDSSVATLSAWSHVAGVWGGGKQMLYVNGQLVCEQALDSAPAANLDGPVNFGGGCQGASAGQCADASHHCSSLPACLQRCSAGCATAANGDIIGGDFDGDLDEAFVYERALSPAAIAGHAGAISEEVVARVGAVLNGIPSKCDDASTSCITSFSASSTPSIASVSPAAGWVGQTITLSGRGFASGMTVTVGGEDCAVQGTPTASEAQCIVGAVSLGENRVSVYVPNKGASANFMPFAAISSVTSVSPSEGSSIGGATLTITGGGLNQAAANVHVGQHTCTVLTATSTTITCQLPRFPSQYSDGTVLPIVVVIGGYKAHGATLSFSPSAGASFALSSASPTTVSAGTALTLTGTDLPTTDTPEVLIGGVACAVTGTPTSTQVQCTVGSGGVGGSHIQVSLRYASGYASGALTVRHSVSLTSVSSGDHGKYGGRTITVGGTGFSAASPSQNIVRMGGRACQVLSATSTEIVAKSPPEADVPSAGAESASAWGSGSTFTTCVATIAGANATQGVADTDTVVAYPSGRNAAWRLTDGDPNTVWYPAVGQTDLVLVIDLGSQVTVHAVSLHMELSGGALPTFTSIGISTACNQATSGVNMTISSASAGVAVLDTPQAARYLLISLTMPQEGGGIRGIAVSSHALEGVPQPITVDVDGSHAPTCSSGCSLSYVDAPVLAGVTPTVISSNGVINVTASNLATCTGVGITVGGEDCSVDQCSVAGWVTCTVPAVRGGTHDVLLMVDGLGSAGSSTALSITVEPNICEVQPSVIGAGGGHDVTISGNGLAPGSSHVEVCGAKCLVSSSNETHITCHQSAYGDRSLVPKKASIDVLISSGADDAMEWINAGSVDAGSKVLGYDMINTETLAMQRVYLRFPVDIPHGATVNDARLHLKAEGQSCDKGSVLNIRLEESDDAPAIEPWIRNSLSGREKGELLEWTTKRKWMWPEEDQESADISTILQAVVDRPGWRAGSHVLVEIEQKVFRNSQGHAIYNRSPCRILAHESGFPAALRASFTSPATPSTSPSGNCNVSVTGGRGTCSTGLIKAKASASSSVVSLHNDHKESYPKEDVASVGGYDWWWEGRNLCAKHSARICVKDDIWNSDTSSPMAWVGAASSTSIFTPYYRYWGHVGDTADEHSWLNLETGANVRSRDDDFDVAKVHSVACCMGVGHPAWMAADGDDASFWRSGMEQGGGATLTLELEAGKEMVESIQIIWGRDHAVAFTLEATADGGTSWETIASEVDADGSSTIYNIGASPRAYTHVRVVSTGYSYGKNRVEIREVKVTGCVRGLAPTTTQTSGCPASGSNATAAALAVADPAVSPSVTSVTPARGTTAGGSDVTILGRLFEASTADISVSIGGFPCAITSVQHDSSEFGNITCKTTASGVTNGGHKYVVVTIAGRGSSRPGLGNDTFWYIDAWSARTTWGGQAPPTGCGEYSADRLCTETIVIPEGQTVLLDVSPPRFYLILVEGTLIFDRKDLHLQAHYILLRGGTLQIGTELEPFLQQALITMYGHPKSIELPTFGAKVIACYRCTLDMHGAPQKTWTQLSSTAQVGDSSIQLVDPVAWPVGSRIVIATTDFESPMSSHTEVATVGSVSGDGRTVTLSDFSVCSTYQFSGIPSNCTTGGSGFKYPHLGESRTFDGRVVNFRAEVGLLNRNVKVIGDHDSVLCPNPEIADDGQTKLSCNQFGAQLFFHSPGHESLAVRLSNVEVANGGQAFRLGRYAIHWHMIGNVRNSFQNDVVVHNSWNRGVAIHGTNHLRLMRNFIYTIMGHSFFIEDGTEEFNRVEDNLGIKTIPSMNLLNTDQTPAVFWIVTMSNYVLRNHAVASRKYGIWMRPEISVTGTSVNTPMDVHPINIPILQIEGNEVHSNGKYGLRVFDVYMPNEPSVVKDLFTWRNGRAGWTATVIGQIGFDGVVSVQQGGVSFESRATDVPNWDVAYVHNALIVDQTDLPLAKSYAMTSDVFAEFKEMGGPQEGGMLFPWNENAGGGFSVANVTFVNFANACLRGCAHCGRGGSPFFGDGAFETRFSGMKFVDSPQRTLFRHPNEAFFYDLDGTLTESGIKEDYTQGGSIKGSSMVGTSVLLPHKHCKPSSYSTQGTGGSVCTGLIFRRSWYHARVPELWVGKAVCVRAPWTATNNYCHNLKPECNCLPYLKKAWKGNVWLAADGYRYNLQTDLLPQEMADPVRWSQKIWDVKGGETFQFTQRFLQFQAADSYGRNLMWTNLGMNRQDWGLNWKYNASYCTEGIGCGRIDQDPSYSVLEDDERGVYLKGVGSKGQLAVPDRSSDKNRQWTFHQDADGNGGQYTHQIAPTEDKHQDYEVKVEQCPHAGCWPPPPPPPPPPPETDLVEWSNPRAWVNLTKSVLNPHNKIKYVKLLDQSIEASVVEETQWAGDVPGDYEDVWIPSWRRVIVDIAKTPLLGHVIVEGILVINSTESVELTATYLEIRGGSVVIASVDENATAVGDFEGNCMIKLVGTNPRLKAIHGPVRETPDVKRGKEGVIQAAGMMGVFGTLVARGKRVSHAWSLLSATAAKGSSLLTVDDTVLWAVGSEVLVSPSRYNMHESETRTVTAVAYESGTGRTVLTLDKALDFDHYADSQEVAYGTKTLRMQSEVALLTRNIVITGDGEGEKGVGGVTYDYQNWNSQKPVIGNAASCGNSVCERSEDSEKCPQDCRGPAHEYGATVHVLGYTEKYVACSRTGSCQSGYQRTFKGTAHISDVEFRHFGQNDLRAGFTQSALAGNVTLERVSFNKGYFYAIELESPEGGAVTDSVMYRSMLPALRIGRKVQGARIDRNLAVIGIWWNTHRGAVHGKGLYIVKRDAMIGMYLDQSLSTVMIGNRAVGSERAGFMGQGKVCGVSGEFTGNEVHSSLSGYWWDNTSPVAGCREISGLTAWRIWLYGFYGETKNVGEVRLTGFKAADIHGAAIDSFVIGGSSLGHQLVDRKVSVTNALLVGATANAGVCNDEVDKPGLHACKHYMAYCWHLNKMPYSGIVIPNFMSGANMAPLIKPWYDAGSYPNLLGRTDIDGVTFVDYGSRCGKTMSAIRANPAAPDASHPLYSTNAEMVRVAHGESTVGLVKSNPAWIDQSDCIDMDCDGNRNTVVRDEDGTLFVNATKGQKGAAVARADFFNSENFFGVPYNLPMNVPDQPWWYPNVPTVMRTTKNGGGVNVTDRWLSNGYGIPRQGCSLYGYTWQCPTTPRSYRMLVLESMDADHEIRRISPVAFSSDDGYTHLANGAQDHGWCFSYTCLKRLMTFWTAVTVNQPYTVHFTGTEPQNIRMSLLHAPPEEAVIVRIYYSRSLRLQVFVGGVYIEDVNMKGGKFKAQLFKDGRVTANDGAGGWARQEVSLDCACKVGDTCHAVTGQSPNCETPSNAHGASSYRRSTGMLEVVVRGHTVDQFVEIRAMPVVQVSMGVSTSVEDFYKVKDSFISNLAGVLGIATSRITIVDVVAGNARRLLNALTGSDGDVGPRRELKSSQTQVSFEVEPGAEVEVEAAAVYVLETAGTASLKVKRTTNIMGSVTVEYTVSSISGTTAVADTDFTPSSGILTFASTVTEQTITVPISDDASYGPDKTFALTLSSPVNATMGTAAVSVVTIRNVNPPTPAAPYMTEAAATSVDMSWVAPDWSSAPPGDDGIIASYDLQCKINDGAWGAATRYEADQVTNGTIADLGTYALVVCRVRAVTASGALGAYSSESASARSLPVCGDGSRQGAEACDDENLLAGDGCSGTCTVESGYSCSMSGGKDTCEAGCGDGTKASSEACDDGDTSSGDGCSNACSVEDGWTCSNASPSDCSTSCGDGKRAGPEACDDGNTDNGDGCSASCLVESSSGWSCSEAAAGEASTCRNCGNGVIEAGEVCDDSTNMQSGCLSTCTAVASGWMCSGAGAGSCVGGPASPGVPIGTGGQRQVSWAWSAPDGRGLPITSYTLETRNALDGSPVNSTVGTSASATRTGLAHATSYVARAKACTSAGCSAFSAWSSSALTQNPPQSDLLTDIGSKVQQEAEAGGLGGLNVTGAPEVDTPPPPPAAPTEENNQGALSTEEMEDLANSLDPTADPAESLNQVAQQVVENGGNPIPVTIGFSSTSFTAVASSGAVAVSVSIVLASGGQATLPMDKSVDWTVVPETAISGVDFEGALTGTLAFASSSTAATLAIPLKVNPVYSGSPRTFKIHLSSPSDLGAGFTMSLHPSFGTATVSITDGKGPITAQFSRSEVRGFKAISVPVTRGDAWKELSARMIYETYDITAKAGSDYASQSAGSVTFAAGSVTGSAQVASITSGKVDVSFGVRVLRVETECSPGTGVFACKGVVGTQSQCSVVIEGGCGNSIRGAGEECDDGNTLAYDGCSATCTVETGFVCAGGEAGSAADKCSISTTPPVGSEIVRASTKLTGITPVQFRADVTIRQGFTDALAASLSVSSSQIAIESLSRRRQQGSVTVSFIVTVPAGEGRKIAQLVSDSAAQGTLAAKLKENGIDVQVELVSSPTITDSSGTAKTLDQINSESTSTSTIIAAAVGSGMSAIVVAGCFIGMVRYMRKKEAAGGGKVAPDSAPAQGAEGTANSPDIEADGGGPMISDLPTKGVLGALLGGRGGGDSPAGSDRALAICQRDVYLAISRDWTNVCEVMFSSGARFATQPVMQALLTSSCVGISPSHIEKLWPTLKKADNGTVDVIKELLEKAAVNDMEQNLLSFFSCLPLEGSKVPVPVLRASLGGVFAPAAVELLVEDAGHTMNFTEFVERARKFAQAGSKTLGSPLKSGDPAGRGQGSLPSIASPPRRKSSLDTLQVDSRRANTASEKSAALHFRAAATRLEITGNPPSMVNRD